jgi:VWFA-related protein
MTTGRSLSRCTFVIPSTVIAVAIMAWACSSLVYAKSNDKEKESSEIKFTARAELVLIPTIVTDKSGKHVAGLKKEDFIVLENGKEQKVATFEEITSDARRMSRPLNPNEFTNSLTSGPSAPRVTLIVLDLLNTRFADQTYARQDLLKYLTQSVDRREPTALYTLTRSGIHVIHDFTTDPRILAAALHKLKGDTSQVVDSPEDVEAVTGSASPDGTAGVDPNAVQSEAQRLQSMMEDAELNFQSFQQRLAITYTLEGMQQVAQTLAGFPGRKSLIWAGGGFPFSVSDDTMQLAPAGRDSLTDVLPLYDHTWKLLNNAQVVLYPVDVKGLEVSITPLASVRNPGRNYARNMSWRQLDTQSTFQTFASMTGGRAYYNSNDLVKGFHDAVSDSAQYYMLGYYLDRARTRAGWRKLAVKVKRDHTEVRARSGFFVTNATIDPESSRNHDIFSALQSPLDYRSLTVVVRWNKVEAGKEPGKKRVNYEMHVAPDAALIDETDNNRVGLDFIAVARTPNGKQAGQPTGQNFNTHLPPERALAIREKGVSYNGAIELTPGEYTVRFVVRDNLSGRLGSVAAPLKVE